MRAYSANALLDFDTSYREDLPTYRRQVSAADSANPAASRVNGARPKILRSEINGLMKSSGQLSKRVDGGEVEAGNLWALVWMGSIASKSPDQARCRLPIGALSDTQNR